MQGEKLDCAAGVPCTCTLAFWARNTGRLQFWEKQGAGLDLYQQKLELRYRAEAM